jgi:hypothetical protein
MGRIVDRIRVLVETCDRMRRGDGVVDFPEVRRRHALDQLRHLQSRSDRAMAADTMLYMAFASFAGTSLVIAIDSATGHRIGAVPTLFATTGVGLLLVACGNLVIEARTALRSNDMEVRLFRELDGLRNAAGAKSTDAGQLYANVHVDCIWTGTHVCVTAEAAQPSKSPLFPLARVGPTHRSIERAIASLESAPPTPTIIPQANDSSPPDHPQMRPNGVGRLWLRMARTEHASTKTKR